MNLPWVEGSFLYNGRDMHSFEQNRSVESIHSACLANSIRVGVKLPFVTTTGTDLRVAERGISKGYAKLSARGCFLVH